MDNIAITIDAEGVALLALNRPDHLNALSPGLLQEACDTLAALAADDQVTALVLTGRGRGFCAGADLGPLSSPQEGASPGEIVADAMERLFNPMMQMLYEFPRPVITAVNGIAAGGGVGIALCADVVILSEAASFKVVQAPKLGIVADLGANWLLPRLGGRSRAMAMCLLGDQVPAPTLVDWGLALEAVAPDELEGRALDYARRLAALPRETVVATRRLVDSACGLSFAQMLEEERQTQLRLCDQPIFVDSVSRFLAKS